MSQEEADITNALVELSKRMGVKTLVQVGAWDGAEACAIKEGTGCRAIAIEANPAVGLCSPSLEFHHMVIGATNGMIPFYVHTSSELSGTLKRDGWGGEPTILPMERLDTFCKNRRITPDALIIDTEGTTLDVLEGAGDTLNGIVMIYAEVQVSHIFPGDRLLPEVDGYLVARGFTQHLGPPSYSCGGQGNYTWVRR